MPFGLFTTDQILAHFMFSCNCEILIESLVYSTFEGFELFIEEVESYQQDQSAPRHCSCSELSVSPYIKILHHSLIRLLETIPLPADSQFPLMIKIAEIINTNLTQHLARKITSYWLLKYICTINQGFC